jgi:hypothetical protein
VPDQTQTIALNLLNLAANGVGGSQLLLRHFRQRSGMAVCKLYKDPFQIWVSCNVVFHSAQDPLVGSSCKQCIREVLRSARQQLV